MPQRNDECTRVVAIEQDRSGSPRDADDDEHRDDHGDRGSGGAQREKSDARQADCYRHACALDHRLHGKPVLEKEYLEGRVERRPGDAVGQRDVGDSSGGHEREQRERLRAHECRRDEHRHREHQHHRWIRDDPEPEPPTSEQPHGKEREKREAHGVQGNRELRQELREAIGAAESGRGAVEQDVLGHVRARGGQDLVGDQEQHEAAGEKPVDWGSR